MKLITNAKQEPRVYYGLHMAEGVAEYKEKAEGYRIFINEATAKAMDPTMAGKPIYVLHQEVDWENLQQEADGFVSESFFNQADGRHWAKFIIVSDKGHEAISKGWKLSNAYVLENSGPGGTWHGVDYAKEVRSARYEHLAIVPNPRYEESVILTPEEFKAYNADKESDLERLKNSKENVEMGFSLFKKAKVENEKDLLGMSVALPKSKKEFTLEQVLNAMDEAEVKKAEPQMANGDHHVMVGDEKMTVNELVKKHLEMKAAENDGVAAAEAEEPEEPGAMQNEDEGEDGEKAENAKKEAEAKAAKKAEGKKNFDKVANANKIDERPMARFSGLSVDQVKRGQQRYGSLKK